MAELVTQLPHDARRVLVRGTSGSGKSTLARRVSATLGVRHVELDSIFHQPGWTGLSDEAFAAAVEELAAEDGWAVCGNYRRVTAPLLERCDTLVLFDLPRAVVMRRIVMRTLRRLARREVLWNGNRERWRNLLSLDPEVSICAWAWTTHGGNHEAVAALLATPPRADVRLVHLASTADERVFFAGLRRAPQPAATDR